MFPVLFMCVLFADIFNSLESKCADRWRNCESLKEDAVYSCDVGGYLYDYCKETCGYCNGGTIPTPQPGCMDYEPNCEIWVQADQCNMNSRFMNKYCRRSCQLCQDVRSKYFKGKPTPEVNSNCKNMHRVCLRNAEEGQCKTNRQFMRIMCKVSCRMCSPYSDCIDKDSICNTWKKQGFCHENHRMYRFMEKNCKFSCQFPGC